MKSKITAVRLSPPPPPDEIQLTMDMETAETLHALLWRGVGGDSNARRRVVSIVTVLREQGVKMADIEVGSFVTLTDR